MNELEPAHIEVEEETETYVRLVAEPLSAGFGTTLGNALRRVLLSSLPGAAVTSVRIEEVEHEFSTIPHMKEDTTEFLLNIKELRLRALADRPAKLYLEASGEGPVTAERIQTTADYEIVNPDLHLATLDAPGARLTVELNVEPGQGYAPAGQSDGLPIGVIPVDAIFSPVRRVAFDIEPTRVEQATNYDKLGLEIETDGSISPRDALASAGATLRNLVGLVADMSEESAGLELGEVSPTLATSPDLELPIEELDLSERPRNCLKRARVDTIGQLVMKTEDDLLAITNFGQKSLDEVIVKLDERGLSLRMKD